MRALCAFQDKTHGPVRRIKRRGVFSNRSDPLIADLPEVAMIDLVTTRPLGGIQAIDQADKSKPRRSADRAQETDELMAFPL
jgi:hypothetical protein